jgi:hypothetical protein
MLMVTVMPSTNDWHYVVVVEPHQVPIWQPPWIKSFILSFFVLLLALVVYGIVLLSIPIG